MSSSLSFSFSLCFSSLSFLSTVFVKSSFIRSPRNSCLQLIGWIGLRFRFEPLCCLVEFEFQTDCGVIWFDSVSCPLRVMGTFSIHFLVRCQEIVELFGHFKAFGMPCVISIVYKVCRCYSEFMQVQHCLESIGTCIICFFFPCLCHTFRLLLLLLCSSSAPVQCLHHIRLWW